MSQNYFIPSPCDFLDGRTWKRCGFSFRRAQWQHGAEITFFAWPGDCGTRVCAQRGVHQPQMACRFVHRPGSGSRQLRANLRCVSISVRYTVANPLRICVGSLQDRWNQFMLDALVWQAVSPAWEGMGCNTLPQGITGAALLCGGSVLAGS